MLGDGSFRERSGKCLPPDATLAAIITGFATAAPAADSNLAYSRGRIGLSAGLRKPPVSPRQSRQVAVRPPASSPLPREARSEIEPYQGWQRLCRAMWRAMTPLYRLPSQHRRRSGCDRAEQRANAAWSAHSGVRLGDHCKCCALLLTLQHRME